MGTFAPPPGPLSRTPSLEVLTTCFRACAQTPTGVQQPCEPPDVSAALDHFLSGPSPRQTAQQAKRLLARQVQSDAPATALQVVQRGIEKRLVQQDPLVGALRRMHALTGELEAMRAFEATYLSLVMAACGAGGPLGEEASARLVADVQAAMASLPLELLSVVSLREAFSDAELLAVTSNPNLRALAAGPARLLALLTQHSAAVLQAMTVCLLRAELGAQGARVQHAALQVTGRTSGGPSCIIPPKRPTALLAIGHQPIDEVRFAAILEASGLQTSLCTTGLARMGLGHEWDEATKQAFAAEWIAYLRPLIADSFYDFDVEAHDRHRAHYPAHVTSMAKKARVMKQAQDDYRAVVDQLLAQKRACAQPRAVQRQFSAARRH